MLLLLILLLLLKPGVRWILRHAGFAAERFLYWLISFTLPPVSSKQPLTLKGDRGRDRLLLQCMQFSPATQGTVTRTHAIVQLQAAQQYAVDAL